MATPIPSFPGAIVTNAQLKAANNLITTTLRVAIDAVNTAIFVNSTAGFGPNTVVSIDNEIIAIDSVTSTPNPMLIANPAGRGYDGTLAAAHPAGAKVQMLIVAWHHNALSSEIQAIESFLGPNGQNLTSGTGIFYAANYDFPAQHPGGSLVAGSNVITLAPVPPGVNATDANHWLYISNGTGTAEAVKITGGTAVAGAASGTVIVTCANSHSGAWTISTATSGGEEAYQAILTTAGGRGTIQFTKAATFHQGIYANSSGDRVAFQGPGREVNLISRAQDYTNGDLFHNSASACWYLRDIGMLNGLPAPASMAGAAVYVGPGQIQMSSVAIFNGGYGVRLVGANTSTLFNVTYVNQDTSFQGTAGLSLEALCINIWVTDCIFGPGNYAAPSNVLGAGMQILAADGVWITNSIFSGYTGISINPTSNYIANVYIVGGGVDGVKQFGVVFTGSGFQIIGVYFIGVHIAAQSDGSTSGLGPVIYIDPTVGGWMNLVSFIGGEITTGSVDGVDIFATGIKSLMFDGVQICENNRSNAANANGMNLVAGVTGLSVTNCRIGNPTGLGHQKYAISAAGALSATITGNDMLNNVTDAVNIAGPFTGILANNNPLDSSVAQTIAAASSITLGSYSFYVITGAVVIATINGGWAGRVVVLQFTSATPGGVNATGNIYTLKTPAQNGTLSLKFDGAKWMVLNA